MKAHSSQTDVAKDFTINHDRYSNPGHRPEIRSVPAWTASLEVNLNFRHLSLIPLLIFLTLGTAFGAETEQASGNAPVEITGPVILSPDLTRRQELADSEQTFSFVFRDPDKVVRITLNDEEIEFQPDTTVVIVRRFKFSQGKSLIRVAAEDGKGNRTERSFLIGFGEKERKYVSATTEEVGESAFNWTVDAYAGFEADSNPTNDMSSAMEPLYGVVPEDNQPDTRFNVGAIFSATYGKFDGVAGISTIQYTKSENDFLNSITTFGGIGYTSYLSNGRSWMLDAMFTDLNVGGYDYAMVQTVSPGLEFRSRGKRGEYRSLVVGLDIIYKTFAIESREDSVQGTLKYDYRSLDESQHHLFHHLFAMGSSSEGTDASEYTFARLDFDWKNRWDYGLLLDFGVGVEHRTFPNNTSLSPDTKLFKLGTKRIDLPFRLEMGAGWKFSDSLKAMFNTNYVFNMSNDVSYERLIYGFTVNAQF